MKRIFLFLSFLAFAFILLFPNKEAKSQEIDYVADAVAALQASNVFVHPNAEGTNVNTVNDLSAYLTKNSPTVLVILPFDALKETDIKTLAQQISLGLNNQKTVGLAIGPNVVGYSAIIPDAPSMMERAKSVSNNPVTALVAFSQSVQLWYDSHEIPTPTPTPEPTPTPRPTMQPIELPKTNEVPLPIWVIFIFGFIVVIVTTAVQIKKARDKSKYDSIMSDLEDN